MFATTNVEDFTTDEGFKDRGITSDEDISLIDYAKKVHDISNDSTTDFKNFDKGDVLVIRDKIDKIKYRPETDSTIIAWEWETGDYDTTNHAAFFLFKGRLTNDFQKGDWIKITLHIATDNEGHERIKEYMGTNIPDSSVVESAHSNLFYGLIIIFPLGALFLGVLPKENREKLNEIIVYDIEEKRREKREKRRRLEEERNRRIESLRSTLNDKKSEFKSVIVSLEKKQDELKRLNGRWKDYKQEISLLKDQAPVPSRINYTIPELEKTKITYENMIRRAYSLQNNLDNSIQQQKEYKSRLRNLKEKIEKKEKSIGDLSDKIKDVQKTADELNIDISRHMSKFDDLQNRFRNIVYKKHNMDSLERTLTIYKDINTSLQKVLSSVQNEVDSEKSKRESFKKWIDELDVSYDEFTPELMEALSPIYTEHKELSNDDSIQQNISQIDQDLEKLNDVLEQYEELSTHDTTAGEKAREQKVEIKQKIENLNKEREQLKELEKERKENLKELEDQGRMVILQYISGKSVSGEEIAEKVKERQRQIRDKVNQTVGRAADIARSAIGESSIEKINVENIDEMTVHQHIYDKWQDIDSPSDITRSDVEELCYLISKFNIKKIGSKYNSELYVPRKNIQREFQRFLDSQDRCFVLLGKSGTGKTNLFCNIWEAYNSQKNVILLKATDPKIENVMNQGGGMGRNRAILDVLTQSLTNLNRDALDKIINVTDKDFIILLDGINEVANKEKMRRFLEDSLHILNEYKNIKLVISSRVHDWQKYFEYSLGNLLKSETLETISSFTQDEVEEAWEKYRKEFNISGDIQKTILDEIKRPILLKILCEVYQGENISDLRSISTIDLWNKFWNKKINTKEEPQIRAFKGLLDYMYEQNKKRVIKDTAFDELTEMKKIYNVSSKLSPFLSDDTILKEEKVPERKFGTHITFTYDKFFEYSIARLLYNKMKVNRNNINSCIREIQERDFPESDGICQFLRKMIE